MLPSMPLARLCLQAIHKSLRLSRSLCPGRAAGGDLFLGAADASLHLRMVEPELIVGDESRRHELVGPAVRALQEEEIAGPHTQGPATLFRKSRAAFFCRGSRMPS